MFPASFLTDLDPPRKLVRIRLASFFNAEDIARFQAELLLAWLRAAGRPPDDQRHQRDGGAEPGRDRTLDAFLADPIHRSRRLAFDVGSTLTRMQVQRAVGSRDAKVSTDALEAEQWTLRRAIGSGRRYGTDDGQVRPGGRRTVRCACMGVGWSKADDDVLEAADAV